MASRCIHIKQGLDLPIAGQPHQVVKRQVATSTAALVGSDYPGLKPAVQVKPGDVVKKGQLLFNHRSDPKLWFTSPVAGVVKAINRGERRVLQSVVVERQSEDQVRFDSYRGQGLETLSVDDIKNLLLESGLWTAIRCRPYARVPYSHELPESIFVNAMDTNPLAADPVIFINDHLEELNAGLAVLSRLAKRLYLCAAPSSQFEQKLIKGCQLTYFEGPHPAGLAGTHIHYLEPIDPEQPEKKIWTVSATDTIAIGCLFQTGTLMTERVISLAGPSVNHPHLIKTHWGACVSEICQGHLKEGAQRCISGSVYAGFTAQGPYDYLGRYHQQISVIPEGGAREFLGWMRPGFNKFSVSRAFLGSWLPRKEYPFNTLMNGSPRAIVPVGVFEKIVPQDTEPTFLARALVSQDVELAVQLGALEMDEEDVGLMSFACPSKNSYGVLLRQILTTHEKEG